MHQGQNAHKDANYSIGNTVNAIVATMCCVRCVLDTSGKYLSKLYNVESLGFTPETNIINLSNVIDK